MLKAYLCSEEKKLKRIEPPDNADRLAQAVWIDLNEPTREEELLVEKTLGIEVPTREETEEIEVSSRLYQSKGAWYMTTAMIAMADTPRPIGTAVTFILIKHRLVTLRYADPRAFITFPAYAERQAELCVSGETVLIGLLDAIIDRTADILERVGADMDDLSLGIFAHDQPGHRAKLSGEDFQAMLSRIGRNHYLISKARESLVSLSRLLGFLLQPDDIRSREDLRSRVGTLTRDVASLTDHTAYISNTVTFLLDALLGMLNIEQNGIIKIFSVAAVIFLPPTLVASIYGMNFEFMPELQWPWGYPFAIGLMIVAAILPYFYFKRRGWL